MELNPDLVICFVDDPSLDGTFFISNDEDNHKKEIIFRWDIGSSQLLSHNWQLRKERLDIENRSDRNKRHSLEHAWSMI